MGKVVRISFNVRFSLGRGVFQGYRIASCVVAACVVKAHADQRIHKSSIESALVETTRISSQIAAGDGVDDRCLKLVPSSFNILNRSILQSVSICCFLPPSFACSCRRCPLQHEPTNRPMGSGGSADGSLVYW